MRKLVIILIAFLAVVTFIRAYDVHGNIKAEVQPVVSESNSGLFNN